MIDLKPCPFCGGEMWTSPDDEGGFIPIGIHDTGCILIFADVYWKMKHWSEEKVAEFWNKRYPDG